MRRREFMTLLSGAAAWPLAARAQQPTIPVVGFLHAGAPDDFVPSLAAFQRGLAENGYVDGQSARIEYRWGRGQYQKIPAFASELVRLPAALIVAGTEVSVLAAKYQPGSKTAWSAP
jgi:putative ABC transport system substrate-binding protein